MKVKTSDFEFMTANADAVLNNAASVTDAFAKPCQNCGETIHFALRSGEQVFSIGLTTILDCLRFAESQGEVPKLSNDWWNLVRNRYNLQEIRLE